MNHGGNTELFWSCASLVYGITVVPNFFELSFDCFMGYVFCRNKSFSGFYKLMHGFEGLIGQHESYSRGLPHIVAVPYGRRLPNIIRAGSVLCDTRARL